MNPWAVAIDVPLEAWWEIVSQGGFGGLLFLIALALIKGWLITPKRLEDIQTLMNARLEAEQARALAAEKREEWWRDLAVQQGALIPRAVSAAEAGISLAKEQS